MAQRESEEDNDEKKNGARYPEHGAVHQALVENVQRPVLRSSPIVIIKNPADRDAYQTDSSDDSSSVDPHTKSSEATSMPSRLLRAPVIGSRGHKDENLPDSHMLPPAMSIETSLLASSHQGGGMAMAYGSLRDSHLQGRFLDGPQSYRDRRTGNLCKLNKVRLEKNNDVAASMPSTMSIGERIMKETKKRQAKKQQDTESSLAAMMQATDMDAGSPSKEVNTRQRVVAFSEVTETMTKGSPDMLLSASLTGFELLRRLSQEKGTQSNHSLQQGVRYGSLDTTTLRTTFPEEGPLMFRSTSDPCPRSIRQSPPSTLQPSDTSRFTLPPPSNIDPPLLTSLSVPRVAAVASSAEPSLISLQGNPLVSVHTATTETLPLQPMGQQEYDPNTEGAFDMDLE